MQRDIELIFPIKDAASAALMTIKADCLHKAGIINEAENQHVHSRARTFLGDATLKDAAYSNLTENNRRFPPPWSAPQKRSPATTTDWSRPVQIAQSRLPEH
jgi:hypothetical protein